MLPKLGILAGGGQLPALVIDACQKSGRTYYVIAFKEQADPKILTGTPHSWVRLGAASQALGILKKEGVKDLVLAGNIHRPSMTQVYPDLWTAKFLARTGILALGDDGLLTSIIKTLENELGFRVVSPESLVPGLLAESGMTSTHLPSQQDQIDIRTAVAAALDLGKQDKGQAAIACDGKVIALEDSKGTDDLLKRVASKRSGILKGCVLAKVAKPQQELRIDLPTIGIRTLKEAANAGLNGIVIEAGRSLVIDRNAVLRLADELNLFIQTISVSEVTGEQ